MFSTIRHRLFSGAFLLLSMAAMLLFAAPASNVLAQQNKLAPAASPTVCALGFSDVSTDNTFYPFINCLVCRGIIGGYSDNTFRPGNPVTRGQVAKFVANAAGFSESYSTSRFSDVTADNVFLPFIERLASRGIIGGYPDGTFRPNNFVTRGQAAAFIANAAGFHDTIPQDRQTFSDVLSSNVFWPFVERVYLHGVINGYSDHTYGPGNQVTRQQMAKFVGNAFFPSCQAHPTSSTPTRTITPSRSNTPSATPTRRTGPPPDPATVAPTIDLSVATDLGTASNFLYTGPDPIQAGMAPGTIDRLRVAVLRGKVLDRQNNPLPGVTISILEHPEYGHTLSRTDGMFDVAVNGGGSLTVNYNKSGYLSVQRQLNTPWQDYVWTPDVILISVDNQVTSINLASSAPIQVVRGSQVTDADGTRQSTLLFAAGTSASMTLANGITRTLTTLHVRSTEYTAGANGPQSMPGDLPPTSGYTYAAEFSVDEALAAGATGVSFSRPVISYIDNFISFPVGGIVPVGHYDRAQGKWIGEQNGLVIKILSITSGMADLDVDGSGAPANAEALQSLGISSAERAQLATLYAPGKSLWRIPLMHFSPLDYNWPYGPPPGAVAPPALPPAPPTPAKPSCTSGSIIQCENQALGEDIAVAGTELSLHYQSDRQPRPRYSLPVKLSGPSVPASLRSITLEVEVAGQRFSQTFPAAANQRYNYTWDGKDAYGRLLQGPQKATLKLSYNYPARYLEPNEWSRAWALASGSGTAGSGNRSTGTVRLTRVLETWVGTWDTLGAGLGGWSLPIHHSYDPIAHTLYMGDGRTRASDSIASHVIKSIAGNGYDSYGGDGGPATQASLNDPRGLALGADGTLYIADYMNQRIRKVGTNGIITTVAGTGSPGFSGDGGPATRALLAGPWDVAVGADGALYIADSGNCRIRRVDTNGIITTVAGAGCNGLPPQDGGPATDANLGYPRGVAVDTDGTLYIADTENERIRRVGTDGIITTVAGTGDEAYAGDGGPATQASLRQPSDVALGADGALYIADTYYGRIRRVGTDGIITTVAGGGPDCPTTYSCGDGGPATQAQVFAGYLAVGADGALYISGGTIRRVGIDGIITTVAGGGHHPYPDNGDGGPPTQANLASYGLALNADGDLYIADRTWDWRSRIRLVDQLLPGLLLTGSVVPSEDGSELYIFDQSGRHQSTADALTRALLYQFAYDSHGYLASITDRDGNVTTIERDSNGNPTAIVAPWGQRTTMRINARDYLGSVTNPANETTQLGYSSDPEAAGLLTSLTDPRGGVHTFQYDNDGRLIRDQNSGGGVKTLSRVESGDVYTVTLTTATSSTASYARVYRVEQLPTGDLRRVVTGPDGTHTETIEYTNGTIRTTYPNGSVVTQTIGPDPRWGMMSPVLTSIAQRLPSGLTTTVGQHRTVRLGSPGDLFSLQALTETTTINGLYYSTTYDAATRAIVSTSAAARQTSTFLDAHGRIDSVWVDGLAPVLYSYDSKGRLQKITQLERVFTFTYDARGNLASITDPLSRTVTFNYDGAGRVLAQTLADGRQIRYTYDANSNILSTTPPGRPNHSFAYTAADLLRQYTPPDVGAGSNSTQYSFNLDQQITGIVRPDGATSSFAYDAAGRLNSVVQPGGTTTITRDPTNGNITSISAPDSSLSYSYDASLPLRVSWAGATSGNVQFSYDDDLRVSAESVNGGNTVSYAYDGDGLLTQAGALILTRDQQSGLVISTRLGSVDSALSYDSFGELSTYSARSYATSLYSSQYTRDPLGRISEKTETVGGTTHTYAYSYDTTGRLTEVRKDGTLVSQYAYDSNGNRLSYSGAGSTFSGAYDNQDRLLTFGSNSYTYTANGELRTKTDQANHSSTTYTYDTQGSLTAVVLPDGTLIQYMVDGTGRRIGKKVNGALVQAFLYRRNLQPIAELDGSGNIVSRFVYAGGSNVPSYMIRGGATYRIIADHLGSPRLVVNSSTGQVVQSIDYDEFGRVLADSNPGFQPFGFAGGIYDLHTKLVRFGARDYDAQVGRWTAKDPIGFHGGSANLFSYIQDDPVNLVDLSGTDWLDTTANISAGIGDALLFGFGDELRSWTDRTFGWNGSSAVNQCSTAYRVANVTTTVATLIAGAGRLAYAATAKGLTLAAGSAEGAVQARNSLKIFFRLGLDQSSRVYTTEQMLEKYKTAEAVIAAAGRTNTGFNSAGAAAAGGALNSLFGTSACSCDH